MLQLFTKKHKGFTLIELLVVISIIGILSSIVVVSMGSAKGKARDARRQSDMRQIGTACELFYTDGSVYPTSETYGGLSIGDYMSSLPVPQSGDTYTWEDNLTPSVPQKFCIWVLAEDDTTYFASSHKGSRMDLIVSPATKGTDCWD